MRSCRASRALPVLLLCAACGTPAGPTPELVSHARPAPAPLPSAIDLESAQVADLVLADRGAEAAEAALAVAALEQLARAEGAAPPGLADNAAELVAAQRGPDAYAAFARRELADGVDDPRLERRLDEYLAAQPLARAEGHRAAQRRGAVASWINRASAPLSRAALGGVLLPFEAGRAALSTLLAQHQQPGISTRERQALAAYQDFLARHPDAQEAPEIKERVAEYRARLTAAERTKALDAAEHALGAGSPALALMHVERAERLPGSEPREAELRVRAEIALAERQHRLEQSYRVEHAPLGPNELAAESELVRWLLLAPPDRAGRAADWLVVPASQEDERAFVSALGRRARGDEDGYIAALEPIAAADPATSAMERHARWLLASPDQNPYGAFRRALRAERSAQQRWLWLGRYAKGRTRRDLPRPLEWLLDVPGFAVSTITLPQRMIAFYSARDRFADPVLRTGERYVARHPDGVHADEVREALETRYARREQWNAVLRLYEARAEPDPARLADYRSKVAARAVAFARQQPRIDVRMAIFTGVARDYSDTPEAAEAQALLRDLVEHSTPQQIRLSRGFLEEHPELWRPDALGLRPELFDGEGDELSDDGVTLVGQTAIEIALVGREPELRRIPPENFARFVALLEEASYERLVGDAREHPQPDPQRDLFFERARLGLLDQPDMRPAAGSHAEFKSSREMHGLIRAGEPLLPIDFVIRGGLDDMGLAAYPRVRPPEETPDAFLYR